MGWRPKSEINQLQILLLEESAIFFKLTDLIFFSQNIRLIWLQTCQGIVNLLKDFFLSAKEMRHTVLAVLCYNNNILFTKSRGI